MKSLRNQFLQTVLGPSGAKALIKAASRATELASAIFPRTITAWVEAVQPFGWEGFIPGTEINLVLNKGAEGFEGHLTLEGSLHKFAQASLFYVSGCIAVALGIEPEVLSPLAKSENLVRLGKSIDLLIKHAVVKAELEKTSWNVKQRRRYQFEPGADKPEVLSGQPLPLSNGTVRKRREAYARKQGLDPILSPGIDFPNSGKTNELSYGRDFGVEHETAHALMTPKDKTLGQYQQWLTDRTNEPSNLDEDFGDKMDAFEEGAHDENVANAMESHIDRRAGLDPHMFQAKFRSSPKGASNGDYDDSDSGPINPKSGTVVSNPVFKEKNNHLPNRVQEPKQNFFNQDIRDEAREHIQGFDEGKKFNSKGQVVQPTGVDAKINQRAKKVQLPSVKRVNKAEIKPQDRLSPNGPAAKPLAPTKPLLPMPEQAENQTKDPTQATGTSNKTSVKLPQVKKPAISITKSESARLCPTCGLAQILKGVFQGCACFRSLKKSVQIVGNRLGGYDLRFDKNWDSEGIVALLEVFKNES